MVCASRTVPFSSCGLPLDFSGLAVCVSNGCYCLFRAESLHRLICVACKPIGLDCRFSPDALLFGFRQGCRNILKYLDPLPVTACYEQYRPVRSEHQSLGREDSKDRLEIAL